MGLYKPRRIWTFYICLLNHFNPRGCISLDHLLLVELQIQLYFNPRGCISLDGHRFYKMAANKSISIHKAV